MLEDQLFQQFETSATDLEKALRTLASSRTKTYYDETRDRINRDNYYASLPSINSLNPSELFHALKNLVEQRHKNKLSYKPATRLYPWVDLYPDLNLRSIYSGEVFNPEEIIREDFRTEQIRNLQIQKLRRTVSAMSAVETRQVLALIEARLPYNCEHVVPQSWFGKREPMKGDLHHLFTCEVKCNSYRGNHPFFDFPEFGESISDRCGKLSENKFEPTAGKGAVARATLYFLLRYPGEIDPTEKEYKVESLKTLLQWHHSYPVTEYEKHRNMAIFETQGNRNPLIDFPDWADKIAFRLGIE
ncbi:endonuclease I family protein [Microseira wollei]|uniref:Endonuclease I n=1 Tax=Microseira wollei NIES-4236 TaxID=2530354 RepID=A0AAV3XPI4_9CYAN|nr:endonuclease [Microseira wollei]GET43050.1 endonuclease I [Microseira wollei NIES-4236]